MEIVLAIALPAATLWLFALRRYERASPDRRAAALYILLAALWLAPSWLTGSTPVALDFLTQMAPWAHLRPPGYLDKNLLLNDVPLQMLPWHEAARRLVWRGELPLLGRFAGAGTPLWVNLQVAILYPVTLAGFFFSTFGWALFSAMTKILSALWLMDRFLKANGMRPLAAMLGAIAYGCGAFTITYLMFPHTNVTILLPALLLAIQRAAGKCAAGVPWPAAGIMAVVIFLMVAGGHPESVLHCSFVALPFALRVMLKMVRKARPHFLMAIAAAGLTALLSAAVLLVPFAAYLPQSQRVEEIRKQPGILATAQFAWRTFVPFVLPNYFGNPRVHNYRESFNYNEIASQYVGLVPLVLALTVIASDWRRHRFWLLLLAAALLMAIQPSWLFGILHQIPIVGLTAHSRLRFVISFILAILAAEGFQRVEERRDLKALGIIAGVVLIALPLFCVASYPLFAQYGIRRLIFFTSISGLMGTAALVLGSKAWNPGLLRLVIPLLVLDLFSVVGLYNPANSREMDYPATPAIRWLQQNGADNRIVGVGRSLMPDTASFFDLEDIRVHDPMSFQPYVAFLDAAGFDRSTYFGQFHSVPPRVLLDYLGVKKIVLPPRTTGWSFWDVTYDGVQPPEWQRQKLAPRPDLNDLKASYSGVDATVFANPMAFPRFFVPSSVSASRTATADFLRVSDPRHVFTASTAPVAPTSIDYRRQGSAVATIRVEASAPSFVASSEVALPGWRLTKGDVPQKLELINGAFLGWRVPAGTSEYVLRYRPPYFVSSAIASMFGALLVATMLLVRPPGAKAGA